MPRGGWAGGRGGRLKIPGFEHDPKLKPDNKPSELFPVSTTLAVQRL
jgi:hypothetical protein